MEDNDSFDWLNDPVTVNPQDYLPQMVATDDKRGNALKRARAKLGYARKTRQWVDAPAPPFPPGHVFTDTFFPWLLKKYPHIQGIHPHYGQESVATGLSIRHKQAVHPAPPPSPLEVLQQENAVLRQENETLKAYVLTLEAETRRWEEHDAQRRRNCGRRPLTEKINS